MHWVEPWAPGKAPGRHGLPGAGLMETVPGAGYMAQASEKGCCRLHPGVRLVSPGNTFRRGASERADAISSCLVPVPMRSPRHGQCHLASLPVPQVGASHLLLGHRIVALGQLPVARPAWFPFPSLPLAGVFPLLGSTACCPGMAPGACRLPTWGGEGQPLLHLQTSFVMVLVRAQKEQPGAETSPAPPRWRHLSSLLSPGSLQLLSSLP